MGTENKINSNFYQIADVNANDDVTGITVQHITATVTANLGTVTGVTITGGSNGQVLTTNGSGVLSWTTSTGGVTTFNTSMDGLTPTVGTSGAVTLAGTLGAISGGTSQSTYATGDILYASNTNTLSKLGIGATGTVLTVSGGVPAWITPTASVLPSISTVTATTTTATVDFTNVDMVRLTLQSTVTDLTITGAVSGQRCILEVYQDASGNKTITWPANVRYGTSITAINPLSTGANKLDRVGFIYSTTATYDVVAVAKGY